MVAKVNQGSVHRTSASKRLGETSPVAVARAVHVAVVVAAVVVMGVVTAADPSRHLRVVVDTVAAAVTDGTAVVVVVVVVAETITETVIAEVEEMSVVAATGTEGIQTATEIVIVIVGVIGGRGRGQGIEIVHVEVREMNVEVAVRMLDHQRRWRRHREHLLPRWHHREGHHRQAWVPRLLDLRPEILARHHQDHPLNRSINM